MSASQFLKLLEQVVENRDQVEKELEGWIFSTVTRKRGRKLVEYQESMPPVEPPKMKHSDLVESLIETHFPDVKSSRATANMLRAAFISAVGKTPAQASRAEKLKLYLRIFELLQPLLEKFYLNRASLASISTSWRKPLKAMYGENSEIYVESIYKLGITREESIKMKTDYKKSVRKSVRESDKAPKFTLEEVYDAIDKSAASDNPLDNIIAVQLACGSRLIEVIKISDFVPAEDPNMIQIEKVAKDKGDDVEERVFLRPVIRISAEEVIEMVEKIRSMHNFQQMSNSVATSKVISGVNKGIKQYFKQDITSHKCRYLYASLAWQLYGKGVPQAEYIRALYGHKSADTTLTYLQYAVHVPGFKLPEDLLTKVDELQIDTAAIKKEQTVLKSDVQDIKKNINRDIADRSMIPVRFPEYVNPKRLRLSTDAKLQLLRELDRSINDSGSRMTQKDAKRYGFGSDVVQKYWHGRPENFG
jgi:integrase